jgi:4-amino-4-deoxy-L-arabinose transferase-like glycosyltransferase
MAAERVSLPRAVCFWALIGLGVLTKGPAILVFVGALGLALVAAPPADRSWLRRPAFWGAAVVAVAVAAPWYLLAGQRAGGTLAQQFFWYEIGSRLVGTPHGHGGPPGYYLLVSLAGWLPWTPLVPGAVLEAFRDRRGDPSARRLLLWAALPWVLLELVPSKLPHYILPCYVPLALLVGRMWDTGLDRPVETRQAVVLRVWATVVGLTAVVPAVFAWRAWPSPAATGLLALTAVLLAGALAIGLAVGRRRLEQAFALAVVIGAAFHAGLGLLVLPALEPYRLSREIARRANAVAAPEAEVLVAGYTEPTLFFYLDRPARLVKAEEIAGRLPHEPAPPGEPDPAPRVYIVREDLREAANAGADVPAERWEQVCGFNYVKGKSECIWVGSRQVK